MKFKEYWNLIEEGIRLVSNNHVILDNDEDTPDDVCYTTIDNSCLCINTSSTVCSSQYDIVDSIYAPYIIYDDEPAPYFKYDENSKSYIKSNETTPTAGKAITIPIYHSFKNDLIINLGSTNFKNIDNDIDIDIDNQLDDNFKKTQTYETGFKNLVKLDYNDVNKFISNAASKYASNIVPNYLKCKFNSIQYPDSKSQHVKNISYIIQSRLKLSNPQKLIKHDSKKLVERFFGDNTPKLRKLFDNTLKIINNSNKPISNKRLAKSAFDELVRIYDTNQSEIDNCFNNISYDPKYRINQTSKAENPGRIPRTDIYKLYLIASWITVLSIRCCNKSNIYAQISSANDVRSTAIALYRYYKDKKNNFINTNNDYYNLANNVDPNEITAIDTYSYGYYNETSISDIKVKKKDNEINLLLVDDNVNLGSTIFALTHQIKEYFSKKYKDYKIKCHWFVLFMPIKDYNSIYNSQSEVLIEPIKPIYNLNPNKSTSSATHTSTLTNTEIDSIITKLTKNCGFKYNKKGGFTISEGDYKFIKTCTSGTHKRSPTSYLPTDPQQTHRRDKKAINYDKLLSDNIKKSLETAIPIISQLLFLHCNNKNARISNMLCRIIGFNPNISANIDSSDEIANTLNAREKDIDTNFVDDLEKFYNKHDYTRCYTLILNKIQSIIDNIKPVNIKLNNTDNSINRNNIKLVKILSKIYVICDYYSKNLQFIQQVYTNKILNKPYKDIQFYKYFLMFNLLTPNLIAGYKDCCNRYNDLICLHIIDEGKECNIVKSKPQARSKSQTTSNITNKQYVLTGLDYKRICEEYAIEREKKYISFKHIFEEKRKYIKSGKYSYKRDEFFLNQIKQKCTNILNRKFIINTNNKNYIKSIKSIKSKNISALVSTINSINNKSVCDVFVDLFKTTNLKPTKLLLTIMKLSTNSQHLKAANDLTYEYYGKQKS